MVKGAGGYCTPSCLCGVGDYPCSKSGDCLPGLLCGADAGEPYGGAFGVDACAPPHCMNRVLDTDKGETLPDCGGPCGENCDICSQANGLVGHCRVYCPCSLGEGACRQSDECVAPLICTGLNRGPRFGLPSNVNICIPAHCTNNSTDWALGETSIDCGNECGCMGPCAGAPCPP